MTLEADHADIDALRDESASSVGSAALRHVVINLFNLVILLPLAWVLLMSVKSLPDATRGDFWPKHFDFTHYGFVFQHIATLPVNLFNSIYVTAATVLITTACAVLAGYALVHIKPFGAGARCDGAARFSLFSRCASSRSSASTRRSIGSASSTTRAASSCPTSRCSSRSAS